MSIEGCPIFFGNISYYTARGPKSLRLLGKGVESPGFVGKKGPNFPTILGLLRKKTVFSG